MRTRLGPTETQLVEETLRAFRVCALEWLELQHPTTAIYSALCECEKLASITLEDVQKVGPMTGSYEHNEGRFSL